MYLLWFCSVMTRAGKTYFGITIENTFRQLSSAFSSCVVINDKGSLMLDFSTQLIFIQKTLCNLFWNLWKISSEIYLFIQPQPWHRCEVNSQSATASKPAGSFAFENIYLAEKFGSCPARPSFPLLWQSGAPHTHWVMGNEKKLRLVYWTTLVD